MQTDFGSDAAFTGSRAGTSHLAFVITSYSIHYTKLYDHAFVMSTSLDSFVDEPPTLNQLYPEPMNDRPLANARAALESVGYWSGELTRSRESSRPSVEEIRLSLAPVV